MSEQQSGTQLERRVDVLEKKLDAAFKRIESLEEDDSSTTSAAGVDHYDQAVLDRIKPGDTVSLHQLRRLYQTHTRISSEKTVKSRIKVLTKRPEFEYIKSSTWRYHGEGGEDGE